MLTKKNNLGEYDLSTILPLNTQALLEMKKSYGFYLNRSSFKEINVFSSLKYTFFLLSILLINSLIET